MGVIFGGILPGGVRRFFFFFGGISIYHCIPKNGRFCFVLFFLVGNLQEA